MSESQIIAENQHSYFTTVPNIVFELGLKANELAVYLTILRTVGDARGKCSKSTKRLAKEAGVSEKVFKAIKKKLALRNPIIKRALIAVKKRVTKDGDPDTDLIVVADIWGDNMSYFASGNAQGEASKKTTPTNAPGGGKNDPRVGAKSPPGVGSKTTPKEERYEEEHLKNGTGMLPPSDMRQSTAFFDPFTYRLRNGDKLDLRTARAFAKYSGDALKKLVANVAWYEQQIDKGTVPKTTHEKFLQWAIKKDMAKSESDIWQNDLYARWQKEEHRLHGMTILKTVVQLDKKDGNRPESVSKALNSASFAAIIDNYTQGIKSKGE